MPRKKSGNCAGIRSVENGSRRKERTPLDERTRLSQFEEACLPHMRAAYALARWLSRDEHQAEDLVQEAYLRALKYFEPGAGANARAWLLKIVRNAFYTARAERRPEARATAFDEEVHSGGEDPFNPE